jgi:hypothetical protein
MSTWHDFWHIHKNSYNFENYACSDLRNGQFFMQGVWWLYVRTSRSYSWGHSHSEVSYEHESSSQQLQCYGDLKCSIHVHVVGVDMFLQASAPVAYELANGTVRLYCEKCHIRSNCELRSNCEHAIYLILTFAIHDSSCGRSVSIVSDYVGWTIGVRSLTGAEDSSSSSCIQTGSGAHPASCTMGTRGPFPRGKARPGSDADHSPPSSVKVKNEQELYLLSPHAPPWHVAGLLYFFLFMDNGKSYITLFQNKKCIYEGLKMILSKWNILPRV